MTFLAVYIRDFRFKVNGDAPKMEEARILMTRAHTVAERQAHALAGASVLGLTIPLLTDSLDHSVESSYAAYPSRTYIVDTEGRVAYRGMPHASEGDLAAIVPILDELLAAEPALG